MKVDYEPDLPFNKKLDELLEFKKDMIAQLDHIVNQSGTILEQNYLQRLTDIIELSRTNPKLSHNEMELLYVDISHCSGIMSQIDDLLKIMPVHPSKFWINETQSENYECRNNPNHEDDKVYNL